MDLSEAHRSAQAEPTATGVQGCKIGGLLTTGVLLRGRLAKVMISSASRLSVSRRLPAVKPEQGHASKTGLDFNILTLTLLRNQGTPSLCSMAHTHTCVEEV
jgi:hypothetical protein